MNTKALKGFNVRVYALCIENNRLLCVKEYFNGAVITKLPGGGLELGESTTDCLKREFKEELNLEIEIEECFYIQEDFVPSLVNDQKQLLTLYFKIGLIHSEKMKIKDTKIQDILWATIGEENPFTLPVDRIVYEKLQRITHQKN